MLGIGCLGEIISKIPLVYYNQSFSNFIKL